MDQKLKLLLEDADHYIRPQPSAADTSDGPFDRFADKKQITDFLQNACESCITKCVYYTAELFAVTVAVEGTIIIFDFCYKYCLI